jgi:hypothetical protein
MFESATLLSHSKLTSGDELISEVYLTVGLNASNNRRHEKQEVD